MDFTWIALFVAAALFLGMVIFSEAGRRLKIAQLASNPDDAPRSVTMAEGAVFGLLGLIIAFTFAGAVTRFQDRRGLVTDETNAIGTAYLRLDLLPPDAQPEMRDLFRQYLDLRLSTYLTARPDAATLTKLAETDVIQGEIWAKVMTGSLESGAHPDAGKLLLPALNDMFDIRTTRISVTQNHPPQIVYILLIGLSLTSAFLVGYGISNRGSHAWLHTAIMAFIMALTFFTIIDLEYPRLGFIRADAADQLLIDLRESMDDTLPGIE